MCSQTLGRLQDGVKLRTALEDDVHTDFPFHPTFDHVDVPDIECTFFGIDIGMGAEGQSGGDEGRQESGLHIE
jgi:hypothetical protein